MAHIRFFEHQLFHYELPITPHDVKKSLLTSLPLLERTALASLPLLALYEPLKTPIATGLNSLRIIKCTREAAIHLQSREWKQAALKTAETATCIIILYQSFYHEKIAAFTASSLELTQSLGEVYIHIRDKEHEKALATLNRAIIATLTLLYMTQGTLEIGLALALIQTLCQLYKCRAHLLKGEYIETAINLVLAGSTAKQVPLYIEKIKLRNAWQATEQRLELYRRLSNTKNIRHLRDHPLEELEQALSEQAAETTRDEHPLEDLNRQVEENTTKKPPLDFGAHFHGFGKDLVKGANLQFKKVTVQGKEYFDLTFKVNRWHRSQINQAINDLIFDSPKDLEMLLDITGSSAQTIKVENGSFSYAHNSIPTRKVTAEGIGQVEVGNNANTPTLYHTVKARLSADKTIYHFHELLSLIGLESAIATSTEEDIERLKIGHLFRVFFPKEATPFERTGEFFKLPIDELKSRIVMMRHEMSQIFDDYLSKMRAVDILPGKKRYAISGLAERAQKAGAKCLTAALLGAWDLEAKLNRTLSILDTGLLAAETRFQNGLNAKGDSNTADLYSGSSDSVFMQMVMKKDSGYSHFFYHSSIRFLISLDALETGTYQYFDDSFGSRTSWEYFQRPGIMEFVNHMAKTAFGYGSNEVMVKEALPASYIEGVVVASNMLKTQLIDRMVQSGLVASKHSLFNGIPIDKFITVG